MVNLVRIWLCACVIAAAVTFLEGENLAGLSAWGSFLLGLPWSALSWGIGWRRAFMEGKPTTPVWVLFGLPLIINIALLLGMLLVGRRGRGAPPS